MDFGIQMWNNADAQMFPIGANHNFYVCDYISILIASIDPNSSSFTEIYTSDETISDAIQKIVSIATCSVSAANENQYERNL